LLVSSLVPMAEAQFRFHVSICGVCGGNVGTDSGFLPKNVEVFLQFLRHVIFLQADLVSLLSNTQTGEKNLRIYDPRRQVGPNLPSGTGWLWIPGVSIPILKIIVSSWGVLKESKIHHLTCCRYIVLQQSIYMCFK
jgi:hypothetical protein